MDYKRAIIEDFQLQSIDGLDCHGLRLLLRIVELTVNVAEGCCMVRIVLISHCYMNAASDQHVQLMKSEDISRRECTFGKQWVDLKTSNASNLLILFYKNEPPGNASDWTEKKK